jgi:hypothetical protein
MKGRSFSEEKELKSRLKLGRFDVVRPILRG